MIVVKLDAKKNAIAFEAMSYIEYCQKYANDSTRVFVDYTQFWTPEDIVQFTQSPLSYYIDASGILRRKVI